MSSFSTIEEVENAINIHLDETLKSNLKTIQLFSKSKKSNHCYPIKFSIDENNNIRIKNSSKYNKNNIYVGSKRQFFYKRYVIPSDNEGDTTNIIILDIETFKTAWNSKNFLIFLNGYLLNNNNFIFQIPDLDNTYEEKRILSSITISKDDNLDIFYIESEDDFHSIPIASYNNINQIMYTCKYSNQILVDIPYPGIRFKKNTRNEFYVFNMQGKYLKPALNETDIEDNNYDYIISEDGNYITLTEENKLSWFGISSLYFTFPNISLPEDIQNITDKNIGKTSKITIINAISLSNNDGLLTFRYNYDPLLSNLKKENILLFDIDDNHIIPYEKFDIYEGSPKKLNETITYNNTEIERAELKLQLKTPENETFPSKINNYCIYLFKDTSDAQSVSFTIYAKNVEENDQKVFDLPDTDNKYFPFIVFHNKQFLNRLNFTFDEQNKTITLNDDYSVKKGDKIRFLSIDSKILYNFQTQFIEVDWTEKIESSVSKFLDIENIKYDYVSDVNYRYNATHISLNTKITNYSNPAIYNNKNITEIDTTKDNIYSRGKFLFFINGIHIPFNYIYRETRKIPTKNKETGEIEDEIKTCVILRKKEKKIKELLEKIKETNTNNTLQCAMIYLKDDFIIDSNLLSQYMDNNDYINIQFKEVEMSPYSKEYPSKNYSKFLTVKFKIR